ncbi:MAG: sensor domain-containing diguanylate cyclase [Chloroflexi bacterium]|nr:sensor domain-containing diguanylate cyclase [Chloroflexota bacterium]
MPTFTDSCIAKLADLSALASGPVPPEEAIQQSLSLLRDGLGAQGVHLVYGWHEGFRSFDTGPSLEVSNIGFWLINRDLTARHKPCSFELRDGRVVDLQDVAVGRPCRYVAALLPVSITSDMLLAQGPWAKGLTDQQNGFMNIALPALGLILESWLDGSRAEHQRNQLSALAHIPGVLSESDNLNTVLTSIAHTIATVAGVNYVSIDVLDEDGGVSLRALNGPERPGIISLSDRWKEAANRPDAVRDEVVRTRKPMLFADAQNDERIPDRGRNYFRRTLIRSTAIFPLIAKSEVLGVLSIASHRPLDFSSQEVELLEGLTTQVAAAITGIRLYQELDESREELRRTNQQLQEAMNLEHHLARTDALTGVPNRRYADEAISAACSHTRRFGHPLSIVIADLDNLKEINDRYSHQTGDSALRYVAQCAKETCREADTVARYGGDELIFVLPSTTQEEAAAFAERFRERLSEHPLVTAEGIKLHQTVSIGVAQWDDSMNGPADLIRQADHAMYQAKAAGRNRTMIAGPGGAARAA